MYKVATYHVHICNTSLQVYRWIYIYVLIRQQNHFIKVKNAFFGNWANFCVALISGRDCSGRLQIEIDINILRAPVQCRGWKKAEILWKACKYNKKENEMEGEENIDCFFNGYLYQLIEK